MKWEIGRQGGNYEKLKLFESQRFLCDCYLIKIHDGSGIPAHVDPALEGYEHHRINLTLNRLGRYDDNFQVQGPVRSWLGGRLVLFRPDLYKHSFRHIDQMWTEDSTYILTIGWLKKAK